MSSNEPMSRVQEYQLYIGGEWVPAASGKRLDSINPYAGRTWATVADAGPADVDRAVAAAREAFEHGPWPATSARDRGKLLRRLGDLGAENAEHLGRVESTDNGKLFREMLGQAQYIPEWYYYFAGLADKLQGDVIPSERPNFMIYTRHEPIGVVAAITPWNSPLLLLAYKLAPALAAGCTFIVKPSEHTPVSALEFAKLVEQAGFPAGVFNVVTGGPETGALLSSHPGINKLSFTGSDRTGMRVLKAAADNLTRVTLELGGKSPNIVFDDADLEAAANGAIAGVFAATGQTCIAGSRLIVHRKVKDELLKRIVDRARTIKLGDPMDPETEMGPVATQPQFEKVMGFLDEAKKAGARFAYGGGRPEGMEGLFVAPTIVTDVRSDMRIVQDEVFGPVMAVLEFETEEEAVRIANDTRFGLVAAIWTSDIDKALWAAGQIESGQVYINTYGAGGGVELPFGGQKQSGFGREKGLEAIHEYTQVKTVAARVRRP
jgi:(Z)-2-((N-methylformamido)methylene)-5-hydroxybutyrolactone dehydrogenase